MTLCEPICRCERRLSSSVFLSIEEIKISSFHNNAGYQKSSKCIHFTIPKVVAARRPAILPKPPIMRHWQGITGRLELGSPTNTLVFPKWSARIKGKAKVYTRSGSVVAHQFHDIRTKRLSKIEENCRKSRRTVGYLTK